MRTHHGITILAAAGILALTGCSSDTKTPASPSAAPSTPAAAPSVDPGALASAGAAAGIPPSPAPTQRAAYLAALTAIDPEIVNGKDDKAVSRGLSQCQAMKDEKDVTKRVAQVEKRFIGPNHPEGFGTTKSAGILAAVQANLCPTY
ncbi:hypothetical protein ACFXD5_06685 [Streptomyces sp. NPDC059385]|uniref:hypothetical protein n=1 Tax=Streptomyces sp. NPDC059385 TaxID=3346817 RepID=UPI003679D586